MNFRQIWARIESDQYKRLLKERKRGANIFLSACNPPYKYDGVDLRSFKRLRFPFENETPVFLYFNYKTLLNLK